MNKMQLAASKQGNPEVHRYSVFLRRTEEDGEPVYEANFREFGSSLSAYGETPAKALNQLYKDGKDFIEILMEDGKEVPEPYTEQPWEDFSGKITVRMPRWLHYKLWQLAEEDGISLNSYVITALSSISENRHCQLRPIGPHFSQVFNTIAYMGHSDKDHVLLGRVKGAWGDVLARPKELNKSHA